MQDLKMQDPKKLQDMKIQDVYFDATFKVVPVLILSTV